MAKRSLQEVDDDYYYGEETFEELDAWLEFLDF